MIFIIAFLLIFLSYELSLCIRHDSQFEKYSFPVSVISALLFIIIIPFRAGSVSIHDTDCTRIHTASELNKFEFQTKINFFAVGPGIMTFLKNGWTYVSDEKLQAPVEEFFRDNNVNLILVNNYFFNHPLIINNNEIENILNDTDFVQIRIAGCDSYLLARKDILTAITNYK
ncbi:MAG: hypothetical protein IPM38_17020 [Ignavibacteria bacterium]|nr:hypothetical protein [Ignavibacteria bacterium]